MNILKNKISDFFTYMKGGIASSPFGKINFEDKLAAIRAAIYGLFSTIITFLGGFFGPEFFQKASEILLGINLPNDTLVTILCSLLAYGLGSACVYFAELQRRKFKDYVEKDNNDRNN